MEGEGKPPVESMLEMTASIVAAYVSYNQLQSSELSDLIRVIHKSLIRISGFREFNDAGPPKATVPEIHSSVSRNYLISFENGKPYKTLRRHLTLRGLSPEAYRAKWGLPTDYPMTAQTYSEQRSQISHTLGFGLQRRKPALAAYEQRRH